LSFMKTKFQCKRGFSLIELLVVISIIATVFGVGYANLRGSQRRQHLNSAVVQVEADLRLAQEMALAGKKTSGCTTNLDGHIFAVDEGTDTYSVTPDCGGGAQVKSASLPGGIQIESSAAGDDFRFNALGRGVDEDGVTITLSFPGSGVASQTIQISTAGEVVVNPTATPVPPTPCPGLKPFHLCAPGETDPLYKCCPPHKCIKYPGQANHLCQL
jgi:prepilin-type N-terminal cleavage/methylation domain-containing protein